MKQRFNNYYSDGLTQNGKLRKVKKQNYICLDGPLKGHKLALSEPETMILTISGQTGRYINTQPKGRTLEWVTCK